MLGLGASAGTKAGPGAASTSKPGIEGSASTVGLGVSDAAAIAASCDARRGPGIITSDGVGVEEAEGPPAVSSVSCCDDGIDCGDGAVINCGLRNLLPSGCRGTGASVGPLGGGTGGGGGGGGDGGGGGGGEGGGARG